MLALHGQIPISELCKERSTVLMRLKTTGVFTLPIRAAQEYIIT
jgi:hypothetical protein